MTRTITGSWIQATRSSLRRRRLQDLIAPAVSVAHPPEDTAVEEVGVIAREVYLLRRSNTFAKSWLKMIMTLNKLLHSLIWTGKAVQTDRVIGIILRLGPVKTGYTLRDGRLILMI